MKDISEVKMDENEDYDSDEEISEKEHSRLLEAISRLDKSQHVKKATRTEPALKVSEYNLVKPRAGQSSSVHLNDLLKTLNKTSTHTEISKKLNKVRRKIKPLPKPLEKPEALKIKRTVGFENIKKTLDRWEPVICANRAAQQIVFPLPKETKLEIKEAHDLMSRFRLKSQLELEMEKLDPKQPIEEEKDEFPLSLDEILERRREAAKLRAQQSYREAKARRQNKIKSKKYHRIQRREKIKQQIKEFELLQKNNPEEALKKLEEIERARAEERMSLRHRSTGKWARNRQIRVKYDKESRQVLAQQLAVSRDLTQKIQNNETSDEDDENSANPSSAQNDESNPWINSVKPSDEVTDFVSSYRKYWLEKNKMDDLKMKLDKMAEAKMARDNEKSENKETKATEVDNNEIFENGVHSEEDEDGSSVKEGSEDISEDELDEFKKKISKLSKEDKKNNKKDKSTKTEKPQKATKKNRKFEKKPKAKKLDPTVLSTMDGWSVEPAINPKKPLNPDIDHIFDDVDYKIQSKLQKQAKKLEQVKNEKVTKKKVKKPKEKYKADLSLKSQRPIRPEIDAPLTELPGRGANETQPKHTANLQNATLNRETQPDNKTPDIDPTSFIKIVPKHIKTANPELITHEEAMDDDENIELDEKQQAIITEAFEDDDIVDEFRQEKQAEIDANKPKDIDLSLPGWGSWGGTNVRPKRRKRRFIFKMPTKIPRKDDNKGDLIIKEHKNTKVKEHQVNELPFPFQNVKDFEASIRAPIGNTFVPETAYKRLIKPSVVTKIGLVIEPMDENQLVLNKIKKLKRKV